ncbi:uncharacterized protein LOC131943617 [Physella acuta]|uniref:uncharacterized protein LOC131943617 n=1 Tax=Physella acuta TaxID=109671 RepID=UPI0027DADB7C|nr:uncharacterized protein LOC131943617 [Physella acuta]XP_059159906.1 uncharacterized protein LOC131943617 [Physella acuta]XP_059159990.1 uncharacterized protein LOC131943617 [Physella acuta]XP_059160072.1 uncharacterized protein LOC131943617 [Physella acuta]
MNSTMFLQSTLNTSLTNTPTNQLSTTQDFPTDIVLMMRVSQMNQHTANILFTELLLSTFLFCICSVSSSCRLPATYRPTSEYFYDAGSVDESGYGYSNEIFTCSMEDFNLAQSTTYLTCMRRQTSCDNCGYFNFTTSQYIGRTCHVEWVSTQAVTIEYTSHRVNFTCDSTRVQCINRGASAIPTLPTSSSTTTDTSVKPSITEIVQLGIPYNEETKDKIFYISNILYATFYTLNTFFPKSLVIVIVILFIVFYLCKHARRKQLESELRRNVRRTTFVDVRNYYTARPRVPRPIKGPKFRRQFYFFKKWLTPSSLFSHNQKLIVVEKII